MDPIYLEEKKEKVLGIIKSPDYKAMRAKDLAVLLNVPREEKKEFLEVIESLLNEGKIIEDYQNRIKIPDANTRVGSFCGTLKGFGFVKLDDCDEEIFIPASCVADAHDKDRVLVSISSGQVMFPGAKREGSILRVLKRGMESIVGTFIKLNGYGFVHPDNQKFGSDIFIPKGFVNHAVSGSKVEVKMVSYGNANKKAEGHIVEVLGHIDDPGSDIMSVVKAFGIPFEFPEGVVNMLPSIPMYVTEEEKVGRLDLRDVQMVTIDGEDSKDLDDAVSLTKENGIYNLGVHIADVSHYVRENSPLDKEALKRGTSNYLIDKVIPMLPHELSNGICSLNAGEDRLALSCLMKIDQKGNVVEHQIVETLVHIDKRMTYTSVKKIIEDRDEEVMKEYEDLCDMFFLMDELSLILSSKRHKRGSIDFDIPECKIKVDEHCKPLEIGPYERNRATKIIEDFMLICNETVAQEYYWLELPFVYRTHETPDPEKIQRLATFINNFGYTIRNTTEEIHPKELQSLLSKIEGTDEENLISRLTLRSLKQAKYTTTCDGHFGLAARFYCHFTSPIRRYPDLIIHRIIKENLNGGISDSRIKHYEKILPDAAYLSSRYERRADEAEREVEKLKKIEYMSDFIGEVFKGVVSGVSSSGLYIELKNTVEGMVRIEDLQGDYFIFDEAGYRLIGEMTKKEYCLGSRLNVRLEEADKFTRSIIFSIVDETEDEDGAENGKQE